MREAKHGGLPWTLNGNTVQLNFAVLGNAMLRGISDPQASAEHVDRLVANARRAVDEWLAPLPLLPPQPTSAELAITLMVSAAALCLKSVITPYLFARCRAARNSPELGDLRGEAGIDVMMANYIDSAYAHYTHARRCSGSVMPPMFAAYSMMVCGGIFAACAHTAPTERLRRRFSAAMRFFADTAHLCSKKTLLFQSAHEEIMAVANMARFLPRRLTEPQLRQIRDAMIPGSIEAVIGRPFSQFIAPIAPILRSSSSAEQPMRACRGVIPLTSNLCAIFGNVFGRPTSETPSKCSLPKSPLSKSPSPESTCVPDLVDEKVPDCRLSFTAVSSLMIGLAVAAKEELFFDFLPCDSKNDSSLNSILN
ncbi:hypothetical protein IWW50_005675 [Coemansia erecta]|nr:hypothetical protein IWW50_005675 [Coemansia erecta]